MIYITSILFIIFFAYYSKWQFSEVRKESIGKWHVYGMLMRISFFASLLLIKYFPATLQDYLLAVTIYVIAFDLLINKIALNKQWLYVGTTSEWDKFFNKTKWIVYGIVLVVAGLIKILT